MTGIILAGGKNTRIQTDKAFLKIGNKVIIEEIVAKLKKVFTEVIIVTNSQESYQYLGVRLVKDIIPDKGSLGGIYSGLVASNTHHNFVVACDMPFVNSQLIEYMRENIKDYDVIIPKANIRFEPLFAIYSKNCIEPIKEQLNKGNLKIVDFFDKVKVKYISEKEIEKFASWYITFFNINTREDMEKAERMASELFSLTDI